MARNGFLKSFTYAWRGVVLASRARNFRVMCGLGVVAVVAGFVFGINRGDWTAIVVCMGVVLATEVVNSAIEALADVVHPDRHPGIAATKDLAAGASLIASAAAAIVAAMVFLPHLIA